MRSRLLAHTLVLAVCGCDRPTENDRGTARTADPTPVELPTAVVPEAMQPPELAAPGASEPPAVGGEHADVVAPTSFDPLAPPPRPAPTDAEIREARTLCGRGWTAFRQGDVAAARAQMDGAIAVLAFGTSDDARRAYGACLYNRGRWAEQSGTTSEARALYERSLAVRPDDTVRARLEGLPAEAPSGPASAIAEVTPPADPSLGEDDEGEGEGMLRPSDADAALLFEHPDNPCRDDVHCAFVLSPMSADESGLRVGLLEVWQHDAEVGVDFPRWRGAADAALTLRLAIQRPGEPLRWGPTVARYDADMSESISVVARIELMPLAGRPTPLVRVVTDLSVREMCCGGRSMTDTSEETLCALHAASEPSACVHALVEHIFEGSAEDPSDDGYGGGSSRYRASAAVSERELRVTATEGEAPSYVRTPADDRFAAHHRLTAGTFDLGSL